MNKKLEKYLCTKYPKILKELVELTPNSCMKWGIQCDNGWFNIINRMFNDIQQYIDRQERFRQLNAYQCWWNRQYFSYIVPIITDKYVEETYPNFCQYVRTHLSYSWYDHTPIPQVEAIQIKEKFGTLRFYYRGGDEHIRNMVNTYTKMSEMVCEKCGAFTHATSPTHATDGWIKTCCENCVPPDKRKNWAKNTDKKLAALVKTINNQENTNL